MKKVAVWKPGSPMKKVAVWKPGSLKAWKPLEAWKPVWKPWKPRFRRARGRVLIDHGQIESDPLARLEMCRLVGILVEGLGGAFIASAPGGRQIDHATGITEAR
jgi:hypothetical protein